MKHYHILVNAPEEQVCRLATDVLEHYAASQVKILSGPRKGLVMLRVRETVVDSLFNAGEMLVTEVKLELDNEFGFGMVMGDSPRRAMAVALIDAALRKGGTLAAYLSDELAILDQQISARNSQLQALVAATKVHFESM